MKNALNVLTLIKKADQVDKKYIAAFALFLNLLLAWADYLTGPLAPFSQLYLIPIIISALFVSDKWTYFIAFLAVLADIPVFMQLLQTFTLTPVIFDFSSKLITYFAFAYLTLLLKKLLIALDELASEDPLTKSKSMRFFNEMGTTELARAYRSKQPLSLAYIDVDNFKEVNDTQGHLHGDRLLIEITSSIKSNLRQEDTIGRLGGDEFAILLVQTDQHQAESIITRIQQDLFKAITPYKTNVTFSIGVITYLGENLLSMRDFVLLADNAMYDIKKSTKNSVQYLIV